MNQLLNVGVRDSLPSYLNDKIKISNQVALMMAGVGLFYTIFSIIFYPGLTIYPIFCIVFSFGAIFLNFLGFVNISRFILSSLVILLAYVYHGFLVQADETFITSMYMIEFALSVIPWVLIDYREKKLLFFALLTCYMLIFTQELANSFLDMELDSALFRSGWLNYVSIGFGVMILVLCLLFMQNKNYQSEVENEKLIDDIHEKNREMEQQQSSLQQNLDEIKAKRILEEKQNWVSKGIAKISDILRQDDSEEIYQKLLIAIVKYLNANQGGIYLLEEDPSGDNYLSLVSCYAYQRKKFIDKKIDLGQGLVGQCYLEKEPIILKEIPEEYLSITSGLGDAPPTFLTIIPLIHESEVSGVLELALFQELENFQIEFLTTLGESIASFVSTNNLNVKTKKLLEQSQIQMEQLRAQEEEMRQNMEELQATQEEMQRKEKEYIERINVLENA